MAKIHRKKILKTGRDRDELFGGTVVVMDQECKAKVTETSYEVSLRTISAELTQEEKRWLDKFLRTIAGKEGVMSDE